MACLDPRDIRIIGFQPFPDTPDLGIKANGEAVAQAWENCKFPDGDLKLCWESTEKVEGWLARVMAISRHCLVVLADLELSKEKQSEFTCL